MAGVPSDHRVFSRYQALAEESLPRSEFGAMLKELVLGAVGSPEQYGAPKPADSIFDAGLTLSQHYLPLVAEGRIEVRPWFDRVDGTQVTLQRRAGGALRRHSLRHGLRDEPALSERTDPPHAQPGCAAHRALQAHLPSATAGACLRRHVGSVRADVSAVELQARWLAYVWSGAVASPTPEEMQLGVAECRARRGEPQKTKMNLMALLFARAAGVEPEPERWPELQRALLFGPLAPVSFRLQGRDALPDAASRFAGEAMAFGCVQSSQFSAAELQKLRRLAGVAQPALRRTAV